MVKLQFGVDTVDYEAMRLHQEQQQRWQEYENERNRYIQAALGNTIEAIMSTSEGYSRGYLGDDEWVALFGHTGGAFEDFYNKQFKEYDLNQWQLELESAEDRYKAELEQARQVEEERRKRPVLEEPVHIGEVLTEVLTELKKSLG
ncbi:hypothetical protein CL614_00905 [archaeon]|nr:hypothetical protein [archaeon]|tara:strand:+ start:1398 stop:1835 length:438 start_codon:yes stop_codon:yes gene_type:complete